MGAICSGCAITGSNARSRHKKSQSAEIHLPDRRMFLLTCTTIKVLMKQKKSVRLQNETENVPGLFGAGTAAICSPSASSRTTSFEQACLPEKIITASASVTGLPSRKGKAMSCLPQDSMNHEIEEVGTRLPVFHAMAHRTVTPHRGIDSNNEALWCCMHHGTGMPNQCILIMVDGSC